MSEKEAGEMNVVLAQILARLDAIVAQQNKLETQFGEHAKLAQLFEVWKAETNLRLQQGVERMNDLQKQVNERVEKRVVAAWMAGAAAGGGGIVAGLIKLFGG